MSKPGLSVDKSNVKKIVKVYDAILKKNKDLKAVVDAALKGKTGAVRAKARRKALKKLAKRNELFRREAKAKLSN